MTASKVASTEINNTKSGWRTVRFGDVVRNVDSSVKNPLELGIERIVGLEHLDPESLHIKRWGNVADGTSFTRKFVSGQVLFGKRRAYQRKAAVADFEGICSGDILVFEPKGDELLPELLPFIVQSDGFFEHALGTSAGSLSPRTKWSDLARYEFPLPPKDEQHRIAEVLWAVDASLSKNENVLEQINLTKQILIPQLLKKGSNYSDTENRNQENWNIKRLKELCNFKTGKLDSNFAKENGEYPFFTCSPETLRIDRYSFDCEAILLAGNNASGIYSVKHYKGKFDAYQRTYVITTNESNLISYEYLMLALTDSLSNLQKMSFGSTTKYLTIGILHNLEIYLPPIEEQEEIMKQVRALELSERNCKNQIESLKNLKKNLVNSQLKN